ncbi:MAG TPA: TetR/AcrR family transcriptional regulator [Rhizomicrobium sp.]|nr:TetR/AcrR family transcriptional regulator [Rhizomicrobium sp.]
MAAGRPRTFCTEKGLDCAMQVFWRKGYEGASMVDLTTAMGINSPSLYAAYGSKEGLFRAVLERYEARRDKFMEEVFAAPTAREVATLFLHGVADFAADTGGQNPPGCLLLQSGMTCGDSAIPDELAKHRAVKEKALCERFARAKAEGDLPQSTVPQALASYIMAVSNGMCVQAASGASVQDLHAVADMALASFAVSAKAPAMA